MKYNKLYHVVYIVSWSTLYCIMNCSILYHELVAMGGTMTRNSLDPLPPLCLSFQPPSLLMNIMMIMTIVIMMIKMIIITAFCSHLLLLPPNQALSLLPFNQITFIWLRSNSLCDGFRKVLLEMERLPEQHHLILSNPQVWLGLHWCDLGLWGWSADWSP